MKSNAYKYKGDINQFHKWFMDAIEFIAFGEYNQIAANNPCWRLEELPTDAGKRLGIDNAVAEEKYCTRVNAVTPADPVVNVGLLNTCFAMALIAFHEINPKIYKQAVKYLADGEERLLPTLCMRVQPETAPLSSLTKSGMLGDDMTKH